MAMTIIIQAALVMPAILVAAKSWKSGWSKMTTRLPWVTIAAMPATTNDMASVAMRALTRKRVTMMPLTRPTAAPTARPAAMPTGVETDGRDERRRRPGQAVRRADRQVDAAGDEDERAGAGHDDDPGLLVEDVGQVLEAQERVADEAQRDDRDDERDGDAGPPDERRQPVA